MTAVKVPGNSSYAMELLCGCRRRWRVFLVGDGDTWIQVNQCIGCGATWEYAQ